ncbi:MAG: transglutaminase domain-containing protein [Planctomycetia bacterium]|nr:transglutaminase domain-containing protein [Planctomycetia bacterium]
MRFSAVALALALSLLPSLARAAEPAPAKLDPGLPYQARRENPVTYDVDFAVTVTAPSHTKVLKVWLPIPQTDAAQDVSEGRISTFPLEVTPKIDVERKYGNKFAYFEFDRPQGAQIIRHSFRVKVWELHWDLDPEKVQRTTKWPAEFEPYLKGESQAVVVDDEVRKLAALLVPSSRGPARDLAALFTGVNGLMKYDHAAASLSASSRHAIEQRRGHCSDYHGLCAALGRSLGHPTRVTYGINAFPKNSPSHCKLEAFLPPYGWVSFDVSETQRLVERVAKDPRLEAKEKERLTTAAAQRLLGGFRDNTWFLQTRGTDYDLAPPAARRVAVVRTIYAEADGQALPDPDPANAEKREFAWMTAQRFKADKEVTYPFEDARTLAREACAGKN